MTGTLRLNRETLEAAILHARTEDPHESVGLIVALPGDGPTRYQPLQNGHARPEHNFAVVADEWVEKLMHCDQTGERFVALVHSHPTGPAQLSPQDVAYTLNVFTTHVLIDLSTEESDRVTAWCVWPDGPRRQEVCVVE